MKAIYLLISFLGLISFSACKKTAFENDYDKSYAKWLSFKKSSNNSYIYTTVSSSVFPEGGSKETKITVMNGSITARDYIASHYERSANSPTATKVVTSQWNEDKASLNSHKNEGAQLLTLDEIYHKAKNEWLKADKKANDIYFETKNNGIISSCGYIPKGCQDDCFSGINISLVTPL
jgi:hypothetical protein